MRTIRIGAGAGMETDRLDPALLSMEKGNLDYICFECLAERTIALAQQRKLSDSSKGYNPLLGYRMRKVLPLAMRHNIKVITNMGAANVEAAVALVAGIARELGLNGLKIAGVTGDDVFPKLDGYADSIVMETGERLAKYRDRIVSANAYLGAGGIVEALDGGAQVVITGRVADPSLFLAPIIHEFGWGKDYSLYGKGTVVGHLLECAGQVSGGYFAVPGLNEVEDLWNLGFPIAEVSEDGEAIIEKVEGTGGRIDGRTCTQQLLYEIHDPARYLTPDCVADFSNVTFEEIGVNRVAVHGATGSPPTETLKVSFGYHDSYMGITEISYGGPKCYERAVLAGETVRRRAEMLGFDVGEWRIDVMGVNSLFAPDTLGTGEGINEVRLRIAARLQDREQAAHIFHEAGSLGVNGPAGGGGRAESMKSVIAILSILVPRDDVAPGVFYEEVR